MANRPELQKRSGNLCELCRSDKELEVYEVPPGQKIGLDGFAYVCKHCFEQIEGIIPMDVNHWRCLNDTMWSEVPAVKVLVWRMLERMRSEAWPRDLLDMLYLDTETLKWANAGSQDQMIQHLDSNGAVLQSGDTVVLVKDLNVKGANFTAKRGTAVRRITLVADNESQIEGKINGQNIVILTQYVRKSK